MKNVEMRSGKYTHNMDAWCEEKYESVVKNLADIVDILWNNKNPWGTRFQSLKKR